MYSTEAVLKEHNELEAELNFYNDMLENLQTQLSSANEDYKETIEEEIKSTKESIEEISLTLKESQAVVVGLPKHAPSGILAIMDNILHQAFVLIFKRVIWLKKEKPKGYFSYNDFVESQKCIEWIEEDDDKLYFNECYDWMRVNAPRSDKNGERISPLPTEKEINKYKGRLYPGPYTFNMVCYIKGANPVSIRESIRRMKNMSLKQIEKAYNEYISLDIYNLNHEEPVEETVWNFPIIEPKEAELKEIEAEKEMVQC